MKAAAIFALLVLSAFNITAAFAQEACSQSGTLEEVHTTILNDTAEDALIHWIDNDCIEHEGTPLAAGEEFPFVTYDGHEFVLRNPAGEIIGEFLVKTTDHEQVVLLSTIISRYLPVQPLICSTTLSAEPLTIIIANDTDTDATISWLDFECFEVPSTPIPANSQYEFTSYAGHEFILRYADGTYISHYTAQATDHGQTIVISELGEQWITIDEAATDDVITAAVQTGVLDSENRVNTFPLEVKAGLYYVISMVSNELDAYLYIYDENGDLIVFNDDGGDGENALVVLNPTEDATYTIGAESYNRAENGRYELHISSPDTIIRTYLSADIGMTETPFDVVEGTTYFVFMNSSDFDTVLEVVDTNGELVATNDDFFSTNSMVVFTASSTGTYILQGMGYHNEASGLFELLTGSFVAPQP